MGWQGAGVLKNLCQNPTPAKDCMPMWTQRQVVPSLCPGVLNFREKLSVLIPLELQTSACKSSAPKCLQQKAPQVMVTSGEMSAFPPGRTYPHSACTAP